MSCQCLAAVSIRDGVVALRALLSQFDIDAKVVSVV